MAKPKFNSIAEAGGTHYDTLGVLASSTSEEIRDAFLYLAKKCHPDLAVIRNTKDEAARELAIREINAAYSVLRDPQQRRAYDRAQVFTAPKCRTCKGTGKVEKLKGFKVTTVACSSCNGTGK